MRHIVDKGQGKPRNSSLVSLAAGQSPRIAIKSNGASWAVWWKDSGAGQVFYAVRSLATESWGPETLLSVAGQNSRSPEIVHSSSAAWIAYEVFSGSTVSITVSEIIDSPEPIPDTAIVATTSYTGDVDVMIHAESTHVWVTWVDSGSYVGWAEHVSGGWSSAQYSSYLESTVEETRAAIRADVLGP